MGVAPLTNTPSVLSSNILASYSPYLMLCWPRGLNSEKNDSNKGHNHDSIELKVKTTT